MSNHGVVVPLVTPIDEHGAVCARSVRRLIACSHPIATGYVPCLTSGEGWRLTPSQWEAMLSAALEHAGPRLVIAGIERPTTGEVVELARLARRMGAAAVMLTSPFGPGVDQPSIVEHYRRVHDAADLDVYIYNETSLSRNETAFDSLLAIAELPRVVGIKDSVPGGRDPAQIAELRDRGLAYYIGWEQQLAAGVPADGCVVSLANLEPALCQVGLHTGDIAVRAAIARLTEVYALLVDDWYRHVKRELAVRGVIASERTLAS